MDGMDDLTRHRLDENDKRADRAEARFDRVEGKLDAIGLRLATVATKETVLGAAAGVLLGGFALLGIIVAILTYLQAFPHPHG